MEVQVSAFPNNRHHRRGRRHHPRARGDIKDRPREKEIPVKYVGFLLPDRFVVGYGLDYDEKYRNLRHLASLDPEDLPDAEGGKQP